MNNNFEYIMWDLQQEINPSKDAVDRLKELNDKSSRTFVGKRIVKMQIVIVLLLILLIPTAVFAAQSLTQVLFEKTKDAGITEKEMEQVLLYLEETSIGVMLSSTCILFKSSSKFSHENTLHFKLFIADRISFSNTL